MAKSVRRQWLDAANNILGLAGVKLIRWEHDFQAYIPFRKTLKDAERSGLAPGDYIEARFNVPGVTQATVDKMVELGALSDRTRRVCEIGPGSGRYLERVKAICQPEHYEIYETSKPWRDWLVRKYGVSSQKADGASLSSTPSKSVDLIHTHKMLYGNPVITIFRYMIEMSRVVKDDGYIVLDLVTEECLTPEILKRWIASGVHHACGMTPKQYAIDFFAMRGFRYVGGFIVPMEPGVTEYFIFTKSQS